VPQQGIETRLGLDELAEDMASRVKRFTAKMGLSEIQAALRALASSPNVDSTRSLRAELVRALARLDLESAWKYALELPEANERQYMLEAAAGELAKTQPQEALRRTLALSSPNLRKGVLRKVFEDWAKVDARAAIGYWNSHKELPADSLGMGLLFSTLARSQPSLAAELALDFRSVSSLTPELNGALRMWVERDAASAMKWAQSLSDPGQRDRALTAAAQGLMYVDPKLAWEAATKLTPGVQANDLRGKLLGQWMEHDPNSAVAYLARLPDAETKTWGASLAYALGQMATLEQQQFLSKIPDGLTKSAMVSSLVQSNNRAGRYAEAVGLLNSLPNSSQRDQSLHTLAIEWAGKDPDATWKWIQQQTDSSDRDLIMAAYSTNLARTNPTSAVQMAMSIPDKLVQIGTLRNIYFNWARADLTAADAWLNTVTLLTEREREMIRRSAATGAGVYVMPTPTVSRNR
jgi:hypothetical protein